MGLFTSPLQKEIDKKADKVYRGMLMLSERLDETGGKITPITKFYFEQAENACYDYMVALKQNQYAVKQVVWNGKKVPVMNTLIAIQGFLEDISQTSGYVFTKLT